MYCYAVIIIMQIYCWGTFALVSMQTTNILTGHCMPGHQILPVCSFKSLPLTVFEILGLKLENKNKNNRRNELFAIYPMLIVHF